MENKMTDNTLEDSPEISPGTRIINTVKNLNFFYHYRQLIRELVIRELKARYRGSMLGFLWSFLNPLLLLAVYRLAFKVIMRNDMEYYAVFLFSGLLPWIWFSSSILEGSNSILNGGSYVTKALFPPEILPATVTFANLVHFLLSLPILLLGLFYFHIHLSTQLIFLPAILFIQLLLTLGLVFLLSVATVYFRDMQHIIGNFLTFWFFLSPIIYKVQNIPEKYRVYFVLNPMTYIMQTYQNIFTEHQPISWGPLGIIAIASLIMFLIGYGIFEHFKDDFPELV
jgi:lipopolysaccharide transport system permease protein